MADQQMIGGYRLRHLIQTSQLTQVYEVVDPSSNVHYAMKVLLPEVADDKSHRATLFHEAEVGIKMRHENVIRITKVDRSLETPFFIMEFFRAGSLRSRILSKEPKEKLFLRQNAMKIFKQIATGLAYMHASGWVHCDVKPDNMLVNAQGELRIIDFAISKKPPTGLAKLFYRKKKPQGTPSYMSPETILGEIVDPRADIYSYGAMLYELTTGRPPFRGNTQTDLLNKHIAEKPVSPGNYNKDLTDEFCMLVLKMLVKKRDDRIETCHKILQALQTIRVYKDDPRPGTEGAM